MNAAVRELPQRPTHRGPGSQDLRRREGSPPPEARRTGLVLAGGGWSAPAIAREAVNSACAEAGLHPAVAVAASLVTLRTVIGAVAARAGHVVLEVTASCDGVCVSLRARFAASPGPVGPTGTAVRTAPWGLGDPDRRDGSTPPEQGSASLFGVVVDAFSVVQGCDGVVVRFEIGRNGAAPPSAAGPALLDEPGAVP